MKVSDEALERAARAIWDAEEQAHSPGDMMPWSEASELAQSGYLRSARAALATVECEACKALVRVVIAAAALARYRAGRG